MRHRSTTAPQLALALAMACASLTFIAACDRAEPSAQARAHAVEAPVQKTQAPSEPAGEEAGEEVHLGEHMYELSRRFAATWFAGQAGNHALVEYQLHEMHEVIEELEPAAPTEKGIDVVARLKSDVEAHFEDLEASVAAGDKKKFTQTYELVMGKCSACHAETGHPFLSVKLPEYNPYPNLEMGQAPEAP